MTPFLATSENIQRLMVTMYKWPMSTWRWYKPEHMLQIILARNTAIWEMDDEVGLLILEEVRPRFDARVNFVIWDGQLAEHYGTMVDALREAGNDLELEQMKAYVPASNKALAKKLVAMGFVEERMEEILPNGERCYCFGIFRGELTHGGMVADTEGPAVSLPEYWGDVSDSLPEQPGVDQYGHPNGHREPVERGAETEPVV